MGGRSFDVLLALVKAGGELVSKHQLLDMAWPGLVVEEANVYVCISQLRKLLGSAAIATVGGLGYRFTLPIRSSGIDRNCSTVPAQRTTFIGREQLLAEARSRFAETRLLTLVGIGGTGKTRLAARLAQSLVDDFPDGIWWIDLAPVGKSQELHAAVALALRCRSKGAGSALSSLTDGLAGRQLMMVLDNCEHLLDAVADLVDALLTAAPGLRIVATSREALGISGETLLPVRPLGLSAPGAADEAIVESEAVRLFMDRAANVAPRLTLNDDRLRDVAQICFRLDGLPLAIELAAMRMRLLSPSQLLQELDNRFLLLTGGMRTLPRQQTLRAMIQWSYEAGGPLAQNALCAISVCSGGCTLEALLALLLKTSDSAEVLGSVGRLFELGLVDVEHMADSARYTVLETVRQYALERLGERGQTPVIRVRHRSYFLALAESVAEGGAGQSSGHRPVNLEVEHDNLLHAMAWCDSDGAAELGLRFALALRPYWSERGLFRIGRDLTLSAVNRPGTEAHPALRSRALRSLTKLFWWLGDPGPGLDCGREALVLARQVGSARLESDALVALSYVHGQLGDHDEAGRTAENALSIARQHGEAAVVHDALVAVADHRYESGELAASETMFQEVKALCQEIGRTQGQAWAALSLADIAVDRGQSDLAKDRLREALLVAVQTRSIHMGAHVIERSAAVAGLDKDWARCLRWFSASSRQREATGLSEQNMTYPQRATMVPQAQSALAAEVVTDAQESGSHLTYEATLNELRLWLGIHIDGSRILR